MITGKTKASTHLASFLSLKIAYVASHTAIHTEVPMPFSSTPHRLFRLAASDTLFFLNACATTPFPRLYQPGTKEVRLWPSEAIPLDSEVKRRGVYS